MHADNSIYFRDPFAHDSHSRGSWPTNPPYVDLVRQLTPPPEMSSKPGYYPQEHGQRYGNHVASQQLHRAPFVPQEHPGADYSRNGVATQPNSRTMSPVFQPRQTTVDDSQLQHGHRRKESQASAIAPSFQIPKSVNDSGGSLSELAAQVSRPHDQ
jgi:hypothetical protein